MANYLKVSMQETIIALDAQGWSQRRIAREVGINRRTVQKYLAAEHSKCTKVTTGSPAQNLANSVSKCTKVTTGSEDSKSLCKPYRNYIERALEKQFSAMRIYQDLVIEHDFPGSYESVKRYVRQLGERIELPFRRMEMAPGKEVQVDYGTGAWLIDEHGKRRKTHLFRIVLSCSRKAYSEVSLAQDAESFIRAIENAFRYFGGVAETIVIDNLKAGVLKPCIYDPELNPKLRSFAKHYGTFVLPCRVAMPRHKGKVESSVKYVQNNALKGRKFRSLAEQNAFLQRWEETIADTRIHGTVKQQVIAMFEEERPFLQELPPTLFPVFHEGKRRVHRDGHVEIARSFYSVPAEYVRREVWVRYNRRMVRIFNHRMEQIAVHSTAEPGKFSTQRGHIPAAKISNPEKGNCYLLNEAKLIGAATGAWAHAMLHNRGPAGARVLNGLLQLADKYTAAAINEGCKTALETSSFRLRNVRQFIEENARAEQLKFNFLTEHPLIREMSQYEKLTPSKELFYEQATS